MSSIPTLSSDEVSNHRFVDKQMAGVIEAIVTHTFSLSNRGLIPSDRQLAAYVDSFEEQALLQIIRAHPGAAATPAHKAADNELLRWARMVGRTTH